jgi:hypothetical protein
LREDGSKRMERKKTYTAFDGSSLMFVVRWKGGRRLDKQEAALERARELASKKEVTLGRAAASQSSAKLPVRFVKQTVPASLRY